VKRSHVAVLAAIALVAAACGNADENLEGARESVRTVEIAMLDVAFKPAAIDVERGENVRFVFENKGEVAHDAFIGDVRAQQAHEDDMRGNGDDDHGGHGNDDEEAVTVDPGKTADLTHTFDDRGTVEIGCHQPGHYGAGMKVVVRVT
jgi:uncharacterized cupredoxin-like copper-binding protein